MVNPKEYSIILRAFEPEDYVYISKWRNNAEMQRLTCGHLRYVSTEMEKAWIHERMINNYRDIYFAICTNNDDKKIIGYTSLNNINYVNRCLESGGIVIGDNEYRDGTALCEALYIVFDYAFNELNMHRMTAKYLSSHVMTESLCKSFYMTVEGIERDAVYKCGRYHDVIDVAILEDEFKTRQDNNEYAIQDIMSRLAKNILAHGKRHRKSNQ